MLVKNGDRLVVTKNVLGILNEGDIVKVVDVNDNGLITFAFGDEFFHKGVMSNDECENHFELVVDKIASSVTFEQIEKIMANSDIIVDTVFGKCTIVTCKLPNGFVIVESSACVSPDNYDEDAGINICLDKITDKIWELEGYRLQEDLYRENMSVDKANSCYDCYCDDCSEDCPCQYEFCEDDDNHLNTDCDDCDDLDCPYNSNRPNN